MGGKLADVATKQHPHPAKDADEKTLFFEMLAQQLGYSKKTLAALLDQEKGSLKTIAKDTITVTNAAVLRLSDGALPKIPRKARACLIQVRAAPVSEWHDGSVPSTTVGILWNPPCFFRLTTKQDMEKFQVIATTATNASLSICYEG